MNVLHQTLIYSTLIKVSGIDVSTYIKNGLEVLSIKTKRVRAGNG